MPYERAFPTGTDTGGKSPPFVPPKIEELAAKFSQLDILEFIGQGGMGAVYKARQKQLDRIVALKILPPQIAAGEGFAGRFTREAQALAKLNHPHIVTLYEFGQVDGLFYFLMEFVDGVNLRQVLKTSRMAPKEALAIVPQICEALQYAHDRGIVHRDIKPENILLGRDGRVKIADFGVAKIVAPDSGETAKSAPPPPGELTQAGSALGTPQYMAPEQIKNSAEVDHRADIYSLGVVFYQMLTGELPSGKIEPPSKKVQIDVRLDEVVLRTLEKKPELRYQQANELKTRVETIAQTPPLGGAASDAAAFIQAAAARDYSLNICHCLNRGWALLISDFWPIVGVSALVWLLSYLATRSVAGIVVGTPLMGGLWLYFLNRIRGNSATVETAFSGFKVAFLQLVLAGVITWLLIILGLICLVLPGIYLWVAWTFALPLVADKGLDFWPAMGLSRRVVSRHWWKFLWFLIVLALIHLVGLMLCFVGIFVAIPLCLATLAYAYEDIFGQVASAPGNAPVGTPVAPPRQGGPWGAVIGIAAGVTAAVLFIAFVGMLLAIAIPNFVRARQYAQAMHAQQVGKSDYIGQTWFPNGDSIEITSVERTSNQMTVKGHYDLVSHDSAKLALFITPTNSGPTPIDPMQQMQITKGKGDFILVHPHLVPGLPHVSMYSTNGHPFASLYFGTSAEASEESQATWITNASPASAESEVSSRQQTAAGLEFTNANFPKVIFISPANGATNVDARQEIHIRFDQPMNPKDLAIQWLSGGFLPDGQPRYEFDQNEFVIPVWLAPDQTNELVVNFGSGAFGGFHGTNSALAQTYRWHFTTKPLAAKLGAAQPKFVSISPTAGETLPVLTLLKITFDQPMIPPNQSPPYLRTIGWGGWGLPALIPSFDYDSASHTFTVPVLLPPDNETRLTLEGFKSADGVASEPVVISCQVGTNDYSSEQLNRIASAAKDPRLQELLSSMKTARAKLTSGVETVQSLSLFGQKESLDNEIMSHWATFKWQGTNQAYADISDAMGMGKAFILGTDGKTCWLYSENEHNERRLDSAPTATVADIYTSVADPFGLTGRTVESAVAKERLVYEGQTQLEGRSCHRVQSWIVRQSQNEPSGVSASKLEWWIDARTFLPLQVVQCSTFGNEIFRFHYDNLNQPLPEAAFQPPVQPGAELKSSDWFERKLGPDDTRFLTIKDGADGAMSGRFGVSGPGGTTSSGLN
ncbi:MAG TPA: protein kinase [Verrucomicrobiae bacterium]|nr:protein kinase [Verrucomicrobiae bacterium]